MQTHCSISSPCQPREQMLPPPCMSQPIQGYTVKTIQRRVLEEQYWPETRPKRLSQWIPRERDSCMSPSYAICIHRPLRKRSNGQQNICKSALAWMRSSIWMKFARRSSLTIQHSTCCADLRKSLLMDTYHCLQGIGFSKHTPTMLRPATAYPRCRHRSI